jgi:transcriptional regulator with XRE-family HTH domain
MNPQTNSAQRLLEQHQLHLGLYARLGKRLKMTPSYISRVANGKRENPKIMAVLLAELRKLQFR